MKKEELVSLMKKKPYLLKMGKGSLSKRFHCSKEDILEAKKAVYNERVGHKLPKILIFDIETAPMRAYVWSRWNQNINLEATISEWYMLAWSAKWLYSNDVMGEVLTSEEAIAEDDNRIVKILWNLIDEADIVIAHNGCVQKDTPVLLKNLQWKPAGELKIGDELITFEEGPTPGSTYRDENNVKRQVSIKKNGKRQLNLGVVTKNKIEKALGMKVTFTNGESVITTLDHYWLASTSTDKNIGWKQTCKLQPGYIVHRVCKPWKKLDNYDAGWMSGFISGEGSLLYSTKKVPSGIQWCQRPTVVKEKSDIIADNLNIERFDYTPKQSHYSLPGHHDVIYTNTTGGKWKTFKLLGELGLDRLINNIDYTKLGSVFTQSDELLVVQKVELCGIQEFAILETDTHTYIADGYLMHNCKADIPWINTRFLLNNLNPPSPYHIIDTYQIAKKQFGFSSNKLDALAGYFGIPHKLKTDFQLWKDCVDGDEKALYYMLEYNKMDTKILEEVYLRLRPWIKGHPNCGNMVDSEIPVCSACGSDKLEELVGQYYYTTIAKYKLYRCKDCGAITRGRENLNRGINKVTNIGR